MKNKLLLNTEKTAQQLLQSIFKNYQEEIQKIQQQKLCKQKLPGQYLNFFKNISTEIYESNKLKYTIKKNSEQFTEPPENSKPKKLFTDKKIRRSMITHKRGQSIEIKQSKFGQQSKQGSIFHRKKTVMNLCQDSKQNQNPHLIPILRTKTQFDEDQEQKIGFLRQKKIKLEEAMKEFNHCDISKAKNTFSEMKKIKEYQQPYFTTDYQGKTILFNTKQKKQKLKKLATPLYKIKTETQPTNLEATASKFYNKKNDQQFSKHQDFEYPQFQGFNLFRGIQSSRKIKQTLLKSNNSHKKSTGSKIRSKDSISQCTERTFHKCLGQSEKIRQSSCLKLFFE